MYLNKCILGQFQLTHCLCWNLMSIDFFGRFWNIIIFVFFGLIFSFHLSQYKESAFKQFCNPVFDLDRITKSSAYKSEFIFFSHLEEQMGQIRCFQINVADCLNRG